MKIRSNNYTVGDVCSRGGSSTVINQQGQNIFSSHVYNLIFKLFSLDNDDDDIQDNGDDMDFGLLRRVGPLSGKAL